MATILITVIFIDFIGLGIPDSIFGACWPAIYTDLNLPIEAANLINFITVGCTVFSALMAPKIIAKLGTPIVTAVSTVLTAVGLLGFSVSGNILFMCVCAFPLGLGAGCIDTGLNNYVSLHYKATHMNFLHCFYGIGVALSPYISSLILKGIGGWQSAYRVMFFVQVGISAVTILSIPIWKKVGRNDAGEEEIQRAVPLKEQVKIKGLVAAAIMLFGSCAVECTAGSWSSTYFAGSKGFSPEDAAAMVTFYYVGMTISRFLCGVIASKLSSWKIIKISLCILFAAIVLLILPMPTFISAAALFMIGFGIGPVFPNVIHLAPQNFGRDISQSTISTQMACAYIGTTLMPPLFGFLAGAFSTDLFPYYLLAMFGVLTVATLITISKIKKAGRYEK